MNHLLRWVKRNSGIDYLAIFSQRKKIMEAFQDKEAETFWGEKEMT